MFKIEDKKEILNVFKKISMKELKEYMNKYISYWHLELLIMFRI